MKKSKQSKQLPQTVEQKQTRKKLKFIGTETYINSATGEVKEFAVEEISERDFNFTKVWFEHLLASYDLIGNQKTKVANYIINHLNRDNLLIDTYRSISDSTGVSVPTVTETMQVLLRVNFLQKIHSGCYRVNPDVLFKGTAGQRLSILQQYQEEGYKPPKLTDEEKIKQLQAGIAEMQKTLDKLQKKKSTTAVVDGQLELLPDGSIVERAHDENEK